MDPDGKAGIFEGCPYGVELRLVVMLVFGLVGGDYEAGEAESGATLDFGDGFGDVVEADGGGALELIGVGCAEVGGPVVEGSEAGCEEVSADIYGEEPGADGRVDDLTHHAIDLHGLEAFIRVVGGERGLFVGPLNGELVEVRVAASGLGRASDGANKNVVAH